MITVSLVSTFVIHPPLDGSVCIAFSDDTYMDLDAEAITGLLTGKVLGTDKGTVCLTKNRLVVTRDESCHVLLFPLTLLDEFVAQLDDHVGAAGVGGLMRKSVYG